MNAKQLIENPVAPIAIIGGGLAGLTLSIGLTFNNIPHQIYESAGAFAEIGAGIALGPNSVRALEQIDPRISEGFRKCVTYNDGVGTDEQGDGVGEAYAEWMDVRVGMANGFNDLIWTVKHTGTPRPGRACFHRAKFLDELIKLVPPSIAHFGKTLKSIDSAEDPSGNLILNFADGSSALASAVIACDGIKSVVRRTYVMSDDPDCPLGWPHSSNEFAYRGMYTKEQFKMITEGRINPGKGTIFCGTEGYIVMYPVEKGEFVNMVAVKRIPDSVATTGSNASSTSGPTPDENSWVRTVDMTTMLEDFSGWGQPIQALLSNIKSPERWYLFDHLPANTYVKGKVALLGDSAHASTPHQGQGAGMAFEDSLVMSELLGKVLGTGSGTPWDMVPALIPRIETSFKAYDEVRRPRTQAVCKTSREMGSMIEFVSPEFGSDLPKIQSNLEHRMNWIWDINLQAEVQRAVEIAAKEIGSIAA